MEGWTWAALRFTEGGFFGTGLLFSFWIIILGAVELDFFMMDKNAPSRPEAIEEKRDQSFPTEGDDPYSMAEGT